MKRKFWHENFYVTFSVPYSYFPKKNQEFHETPEEPFTGHSETGTTLEIAYKPFLTMLFCHLYLFGWSITLGV